MNYTYLVILLSFLLTCVFGMVVRMSKLVEEEKKAMLDLHESTKKLAEGLEMAGVELKRHECELARLDNEIDDLSNKQLSSADKIEDVFYGQKVMNDMLTESIAKIDNLVKSEPVAEETLKEEPKQAKPKAKKTTTKKKKTEKKCECDCKCKES